MNCGYVKTTWFPLSYVIIVIIIYSFTMFHYCSYYGRYSCYHFDYYCYIYIRAHHCYTSWLFSWFSAHFHLNSTAGGTFFRPGQVAGWNRGGKPHWWMVNGWWVHFESGDGWWMVGEWIPWNLAITFPVTFLTCQAMHQDAFYGCTPISCLVHQSTGTFPLIKVRLKLGMLCF